MELFTTDAIGADSGLCRCACWRNHPETRFTGHRLTCQGGVYQGADVCGACLDAMAATYATGGR